MSKTVQQIVALLAKTNTQKVNQSDYNHSKLLEELVELSEVLIKIINKIPEKQPNEDKVIEEVGDVALRIEILVKQRGISKQVKERMEQKAQKLYSYFLEGKYNGGI